MRVFVRLASALAVVAALLSLSVAPRSAQAQTVYAPITSASLDSITTVDGVPLVVCQDTVESYNRWHGTCEYLRTVDLPFGSYVAGVIEYIYYDGTYYERFNNETTWTSYPDTLYDPSLSITDDLLIDGVFAGDYTETIIGNTFVDGFATTQFQYWSTDPDLFDSKVESTYDIFLSADGIIHKTVSSTRAPEYNFVSERLVTDINIPVTIAAPDPASVIPASSGSATPSLSFSFHAFGHK